MIRHNMELLRAAAQKAGVGDIRFVEAEQRNHITIVTSLARKGDEAVRSAMVDFVRQRCQALDAKKEPDSDASLVALQAGRFRERCERGP